ncbi:MAG: threonine-phosphate decarboxylase CobD [Magnetococcus sp. DMHC-8]
MLEHGGGIRRAAAQFGLPLDQWLDLSTGINPLGWLPLAIPRSCWARLPEEEDGLEEIARAYYRVAVLLPLAGSQSAIQALPHLRPPGRVAVLGPTYAEHAAAWAAAGHTVAEVTLADLEVGMERFDVVVVVNPNNPTGLLLPIPRLLSWQERLQRAGGWLVVDEAFMDVTPVHSLAGQVGLPGLILLRSLGKFFGLAGARVGFLLAEAALLERVRALLGPWHLAGPSRWLAGQALADVAWQEESRCRLPAAARRLAGLLGAHGWSPAGGTALFQWVVTAQAEQGWLTLARRGILVRHFPEWRALRIGLPGEEPEWSRLAEGLDALTRMDHDAAGPGLP